MNAEREHGGTGKHDQLEQMPSEQGGLYRAGSGDKRRWQQSCAWRRVRSITHMLAMVSAALLLSLPFN